MMNVDGAQCVEGRAYVKREAGRRDQISITLNLPLKSAGGSERYTSAFFLSIFAFFLVFSPSFLSAHPSCFRPLPSHTPVVLLVLGLSCPALFSQCVFFFLWMVNMKSSGRTPNKPAALSHQTYNVSVRLSVS